MPAKLNDRFRAILQERDRVIMSSAKLKSFFSVWTVPLLLWATHPAVFVSFSAVPLHGILNKEQLRFLLSRLELVDCGGISQEGVWHEFCHYQ